MTLASDVSGLPPKADRAFGLKLVGPALALLVVLLAFPTALTIIYSLHDVPANGASLGAFVGIENFEIVFSSPVFWRSAIVTLNFSIGFVILSTVIGLAMALLLNQKFIGRGLARAMLIIPWATPWLVIGILWKWFADGSVGGLNAVLVMIGATTEYYDFLSDPNTAMPITVLAAVWRQASFAGILLLAGLQALPGELHEAASLDGARGLKAFWYITLPAVRNVLIVAILITTIGGFKVFDFIFVLTQGGPANATQVLGTYIYLQAFNLTNMGYANAIAVVLLAIAVLLGWLQLKASRRA